MGSCGARLSLRAPCTPSTWDELAAPSSVAVATACHILESRRYLSPCPVLLALLPGAQHIDEALTLPRGQDSQGAHKVEAYAFPQYQCTCVGSRLQRLQERRLRVIVTCQALCCRIARMRPSLSLPSSDLQDRLSLPDLSPLVRQGDRPASSRSRGKNMTPRLLLGSRRLTLGHLCPVSVEAISRRTASSARASRSWS